MFTAGFLEANAGAIARGNGAGLFAYHRTTDARLSMTARTPDGTGSGWACSAGDPAGEIDGSVSARIAAQKAVASRAIRRRSSRDSTRHVLEPSAVTDLVPLLAGAMQRARR